MSSRLDVFELNKRGGLQEGGQARVTQSSQPSGAVPFLLVSPLQLGHLNSCLTLPSDLSSRVLAGQLQVQSSLYSVRYDLETSLSVSGGHFCRCLCQVPFHGGHSLSERGFLALVTS